MSVTRQACVRWRRRCKACPSPSHGSISKKTAGTECEAPSKAWPYAQVMKRCKSLPKAIHSRVMDSAVIPGGSNVGRRPREVGSEAHRVQRRAEFLRVARGSRDHVFPASRNGTNSGSRLESRLLGVVRGSPENFRSPSRGWRRSRDFRDRLACFKCADR